MQAPAPRRRQPSIFLNHTPRTFEVVDRDCYHIGCLGSNGDRAQLSRPVVARRSEESLSKSSMQSKKSNKASVTSKRDDTSKPRPSNPNQRRLLQHRGMAVTADEVVGRQFPHLPTSNPSFDMAFFLKNTGPPRKHLDAVEYDRDTHAKHKGPLKFLKGGGRRATSLTG